MSMKCCLDSKGNQKLHGTLFIFHVISVAPPHDCYEHQKTTFLQAAAADCDCFPYTATLSTNNYQILPSTMPERLLQNALMADFPNSALKYLCQVSLS